MALPDFPNNPSLGERYYSGKNVYEWDGSKWKSIGSLTKEDVVTTSDLLTSKSFKEGDVVTTIGFYIEGDGGGGQWKATSTTGLTPSQAPADLGAGALVDGSGRLWNIVGKPVFTLEEFGGFPSTGEDSILFFRAALAYCRNNGGSIKLSAGEWLVSGIVDIYDSNGTFLSGEGEDKTFIKAFGSYTGGLVRHQSTQGAAAKALGGGVLNLTVDGQDTNSYCLFSNSVNHAIYSNLKLIDPASTGNAFWMSCLDDKIGPDAADGQHCEVKNIFTRTLSGGRGVFVDGNAGLAATVGANASLNYFENIFCQIGGSADGFVFGFADGNTLNFLRVNQLPSSTGYGLVFAADNTDNKRHARQNICYSVQTAVSGVIAKAGDGTEPSFQNAIYGFNTGNAGIDNSPIVENGASLQWIDQTQAAFLGLNKGLSVGTGSYLASSADIVNIQDTDTPESAHTLFSRTGSHLDFISSTDGSGDKWRMGFSEGGKFSVTRPRSSGQPFMINAPIELQGQSIVGGKLRIMINFQEYEIDITPV